MRVKKYLAVACMWIPAWIDGIFSIRFEGNMWIIMPIYWAMLALFVVALRWRLRLERESR